MNRRRQGLGHLETAVLGVVATAKTPVNVAEVQEQLTEELAYTTVMSTLARLAEKGALRRTLVGRAYHYQLAAPAASISDVLTARQMRHLMDGGGDRAAVLARFVAELDDDDEQILAELLKLSRSRKRTR
jgi:predicted transcriptional regulator